MATIYLVTLHVSDKELPVVLGAISGSAKLVSVTPTTEEPKVDPKPRAMGYVDGKRDKGISGEELVLEVLARESRAFTIMEIEEAFQTRRFSINSVSPNLHRLLAAGKIKRLSNGLYCLPGTVIKLGAGFTK